MRLPLSISFRGISPKDWIEADIRRHAEKLNTYYRDIMSCRVTVEIPHWHHEKGNRFALRIDLTVPGDEIVVNHESSLHSSTQDFGALEWAKALEVEGMRKDLRLVIREAFDAARRQLQDYARRQRGAVKTHEAAL